MKPWLLLAALLVLIAPAHALTERQELEKWCTGSSIAASGRCIGYLLAAEDAMATGTIAGIKACLPLDIKLSEQHRLVLAWLSENPDTTAETALILVARAYARSYPCP